MFETWPCGEGAPGISPGRMADLEADAEMARRTRDRMRMLEVRVRELEARLDLLTEVLRRSGVDGLYCAQLEAKQA